MPFMSAWSFLGDACPGRAVLAGLQTIASLQFDHLGEGSQHRRREHPDRLANIRGIPSREGPKHRRELRPLLLVECLRDPVGPQGQIGFLLLGSHGCIEVAANHLEYY